MTKKHSGDKKSMAEKKVEKTETSKENRGKKLQGKVDQPSESWLPL